MMTAEQLIDCLKDFPPDKNVVLFTKDDSIPYEIEKVFINYSGEHDFDHIVIHEAGGEDGDDSGQRKPRVLPLGELIQLRCTDVWLEENCETVIHPLYLVESETAERHQVTFFWPSVVRPHKTYNKTWRCWTARPTEEERKAVPWNG